MRRRRHALVVVLLVLLSEFLSAQVPAAERAGRRPMTLDDVLAAPVRHAPAGLAGLRLSADGNSVSYVRVATGDTPAALVRHTLPDGPEEVLLSAPELKAAFADAGAPEPGAMVEALAALAPSSTGGFEGTIGGVSYRLSGTPAKLRRTRAAPPEAEAVAASPDGACLAFVKDFDVQLLSRDGVTTPVTAGGHADLKHGLAVSRVEFGIKDGLFWDPTGRRLAFYREDFRPIEPYPSIDFRPRPAKLERRRYPMAGRRGSEVSIGVFDTQGGGVVWLEVDRDRHEYWTNVTWTRDGRHLCVAAVSRDQRRMDLLVFDPATGRVERTLLSESDEQWVEPELGPAFVPDGSGRFLWRGYRSGSPYRHWHLHAADGSFVRTVTAGDCDMIDLICFRDGGRSVLVTTTGPDPRERHLAVAGLDGGFRVLTSAPGTHEVLVAPTGRFGIDRRSSVGEPLVTEVLDLDAGRVVATLHRAADPLARFVHGRESLFDVTTKDGRILHGLRIDPPVIEEGRRYPVIHYVYGGPHSQLVTNAWLSGGSRWNYWMHFMAARGFVVFYLDGRGTDFRGIEWQQAVHRRLGTLEIEDQLDGLDAVLALPYADRARVGVHGWSYGGFMTLSLLTRTEGRYQAGVAGAPVTDWAYYETGYGERYMDTPEENPEGYREANPGEHLARLRSRLLLVHGTADETVVLQNSIDFIGRAVAAGVLLDTMFYPGQDHALRGASFRHFLATMTDYFDQHLRP